MTTKKKKISVETIFRSRTTELGRRAIEFVDWLKVKNYSPQTVDMRMRCLHHFLDWAEEREIKEIDNLCVELIERYGKHLLHARDSKGNPFTALNRYVYLTALAQFCRWLVRQDFLWNDPAAKIVYPKIIKGLPKNVPGHKQIEEILSKPDIETPIGLRDRAIMETLYSTGMRRSEVVSLTVQDVDRQNGLICIRHGKGGKMRIVPLGERARQWIEKYLLEVRSDWAQDEKENTLFIGSSGKSIGIVQTTCMVHNYVKKCGLSGSCHIFRHAMATQMLDHGANLRHIQEILGHESICTTEIYTHIGIEKIKEVYQKSHPACKHSMPQIKEAPIKMSHLNLQNLRPIHHSKPWPENELAKWAQEYLESLRLAGYRLQSVKDYSKSLMQFIVWCQKENIDGPKWLSQSLLEKYHKHLTCKETRGKPISVRGILGLLLVVMQFCRFLANRQILPYDITKKIQLPKVKRNIPCQVLNEQEVASILAQPDLTTAMGLRDRAILEMLYATGIRRIELVALDVGDLDVQACTVFIRNGKGGKDRIVPIAQTALAWVQKYLELVRPLLLQNKEEKALFLGCSGERIEKSSFGKRLKKYARSSGVTKPVSCHQFRHAMATALLDNGADLRHIQEILGHRSLFSTQIYTKVAIRKLKEVHEQTHPARSKPDPNRTI